MPQNTLTYATFNSIGRDIGRRTIQEHLFNTISANVKSGNCFKNREARQQRDHRHAWEDRVYLP